MCRKYRIYAVCIWFWPTPGLAHLLLCTASPCMPYCIVTTKYRLYFINKYLYCDISCRLLFPPCTQHTHTHTRTRTLTHTHKQTHTHTCEHRLLDAKMAQRVPNSLPVIPMADVQSLTYLDGHLPGDMGFDPLHLFDPTNGGAGFLSQEWLRCAGLHACVCEFVTCIALH